MSTKTGMSRNKDYLDEIIRQRFDTKNFDPHGFLDVLREKCCALIPASKQKKSEALRTCFLFNLAWHCFRDWAIFGPAVRGLFYDFHTYIAECAPDRLGRIRYNRDDDPRPFDETEKQIIQEQVLPQLDELVVEPGQGPTLVPLAEYSKEEQTSASLRTPTPETRTESPQERESRRMGPARVKAATAARRKPLVFVSHQMRERMQESMGLAARYGDLDRIITTRQMLKWRPAREIKTDD
jgi:hypothetical protein